jgi:hypothetical protein
VKIADITNAIGYASNKKVIIPARQRRWKAQRHPFVPRTPFGRSFQLYPDQSIEPSSFRFAAAMTTCRKAASKVDFIKVDVIVSPDSPANLPRRRAETPLIALFRFVEPAL